MRHFYFIKVEKRRSVANPLESQPPAPEPLLLLYTDARIQKGNRLCRRTSSKQEQEAHFKSLQMLMTYRLACEDYLSQSKNGFKETSQTSLLSERRGYEVQMGKLFVIQADRT